MINEDRMKDLVKKLKGLVNDNYLLGYEYNMLKEAIDLIPLGWQVANNREDSRVGVALESDDND